MKKPWGPVKVGLLTLAFLVIDLAFLGANLPKLRTGGWVPLSLATLLLLVMTTWHSGTRAIQRRLEQLVVPLGTFSESLPRLGVVRIPGSAVFLAREDRGSPPMLTHFVRRTRSLAENVLLLHVRVLHVPRVAPTERAHTETLSHGFVRVTATYGYMEVPDLGELLEELETAGLPLVASETTVFVGHSILTVTGESRWHRLRAALFDFLSRNAHPAPSHYRLPADQVVVLGARLEL